MKADTMTKLKTQLWTNPTGKRFVVLPEADFIRMSELIEDRGLSRILKEAIATDTDEPSIPLAEVKRQLAAQRQSPARKRRR
jgi:PHD/YefM family antitoxin component YafN of YafNO toxin-antitoxin module